jgi:murein DD-endopeptidase MepM/ murein hydrolase activator NlpD
MKRRTPMLWVFICIGFLPLLVDAASNAESDQHPNLLTPQYYNLADDDPFRLEMDDFLAIAQADPFHHPFEAADGRTLAVSIPPIGAFGAGKGPGDMGTHHPAVDLHVAGRETDVEIYAAHDGTVTVQRDAPKYRHVLAITTDVIGDAGEVLGKIVTLYAHIDLDLDEADGLLLDGQVVEKGDLVSKHLYADTVGGPHLHLEIRYYRPGDAGDETFYGLPMPGGDRELTEPSAGPWRYGVWHPTVGYGFGDPRNHGLKLE